MREFCIRLRNLVHSGATKGEISATQDVMMEEVITIIWIFCDGSKELSKYFHLLNWLGSIVIAVNVELNWKLLTLQLKKLRCKLCILVWDLHLTSSDSQFNVLYNSFFYSFHKYWIPARTLALGIQKRERHSLYKVFDLFEKETHE